ncbi:pyridoxamine 5'-phosphate oxidase family protein [Staphylococcus hyicus]|uniref:pyridoxamine 5'-phosphate oxidase family protein n=1 Tax=Staphylococcus hyicus TaxID=1284 RepID=UPI00208E4F41|nr:pyridoxamine 5'-phosphate oxidase family protein [Staphylococcus hyicus]MCO4329257.1 pyridoxamine 5'-phosphate oxidase family protein [Staphylococcus hyicus]MCO4332287.1 pyridoxamine 5'-phosphate oxidase family protein [Staphylococcus hyicus]MCO4333238.1 pyridoxamine 5'-phosphate oxidase family protein [Staphylococcus hyicus]MCO4336984.1 pyridoxamine 5'-phosphate oxidase family protein [Staphylococcus hyicus]
MKQEVIQKINDVIAHSRIGVLATSYQDQPNSRYMIFYNNGLDLYTKTSKKTPKVQEMKHNPKVHVLLGYEENQTQPYVEIEGVIEFVTDQNQIDWLWKEQDKTFFDSKDDPNFVVLRVIPNTITLHASKGGNGPIEINVSTL